MKDDGCMESVFFFVNSLNKPVDETGLFFLSFVDNDRLKGSEFR